jgi:hypothetical protein
MGSTRNLYRAVVIAAITVMLGACADPASIRPGDQEAATIAHQGKPTLILPRPDGGKRLVYSMQPLGQFTWIADTDANGRIISNFQALTTKRFNLINDGLEQGLWNADRITYEFGPPAHISRVGLHGEQIVWEYRFREDDVWNSLMYIYVTDKGVVTRFHPGPDPMAQPGGMFGGM